MRHIIRPNVTTPLAIFALLVASDSVASPSVAPEFAKCDPANVLGVESCVKCHGPEIEQWKNTPHYATFETLHRKPEAKEIAKRLGLRSVKRNETCTKCHYTCQEVDGRERVVAGVSCESCHGAAKDWIDLHSDYGGSNVTRALESPEHREQRIKASMAAGMNNPTNLYLVARQCLACHTSPDEKLVNVGGHVAGSAEFELVSWSQGIVRHNFLRGGGQTNVPSTPEQLRVMYIVGVMADLEASFRATAIATEKATYGVTAAKRSLAQKKRLYEIRQLVDNEHVAQAMDVALATKLKLNNREALLAASKEIGQAAFQFAASADGRKLQAIDKLLPAVNQYK
ncbi:cytochrome c family protein [Adhaeretor mobilis]|uniref:Perchlorate reductase subunit gamma n=1 Tax=Adhaeretor mobilis TaxID=1930276 RepID=A0A517N0H9_9BACT|nr:cytochrome c family protein [Adhaeretor mobilis]QDT00633.1 Perchlorate reductase subunit gamma precursor [Adhaeretor mobilis]